MLKLGVFLHRKHQLAVSQSQSPWENSLWKHQGNRNSFCILNEAWFPMSLDTRVDLRGFGWMIAGRDRNKIEKPNRSMNEWRVGVKDRHCQGLLAVEWNRCLWVQACQVKGSLNRLNRSTDQQKLEELLGFWARDWRVVGACEWLQCLWHDFYSNISLANTQQQAFNRCIMTWTWKSLLRFSLHKKYFWFSGLSWSCIHFLWLLILIRVAGAYPNWHWVDHQVLVVQKSTKIGDIATSLCCIESWVNVRLEHLLADQCTGYVGRYGGKRAHCRKTN